MFNEDLLIINNKQTNKKIWIYLRILDKLVFWHKKDRSMNFDGFETYSSQVLLRMLKVSKFTSNLKKNSIIAKVPYKTIALSPYSSNAKFRNIILTFIWKYMFHNTVYTRTTKKWTSAIHRRNQDQDNLCDKNCSAKYLHLENLSMQF